MCTKAFLDTAAVPTLSAHSLCHRFLFRTIRIFSFAAQFCLEGPETETFFDPRPRVV
jgi:hypothetical protein